KGVPGGALAVVIDGELRFATGVGVQRLGSDLPVTRDTRFRVASVSKMVVAATVLSLAQDGLLALDDRLRDIAPDFAEPPRADADVDQVTIERLLTHTAAIPDFACTDELALDETRRRWAAAPLWGPPATFFQLLELRLRPPRLGDRGPHARRLSRRRRPARLRARLHGQRELRRRRRARGRPHRRPRRVGAPDRLPRVASGGGRHRQRGRLRTFRRSAPRRRRRDALDRVDRRDAAGPRAHRRAPAPHVRLWG